MCEANLRECEFCELKTPQGLCDIKIAGNFDADFDKCTFDRMKGLCENFGDKRLPLNKRTKMKWSWEKMQYEEKE